MLETHGLLSEQVAAALGGRTRVIEALDKVFRSSAHGPELVGCAHEVATLLQARLLWPVIASPTDPALLAFAEQWVIDVASMTDKQVSEVVSVVGEDGLMDFVHSLLVIEQRIRLDLAWQQLGLLHSVGYDHDGTVSPMGNFGATGPLLSLTNQSTQGRSPEAGAEQGRRRISPGRHGSPSLSAALGEWQAAAVCLDQVDPITTELVRLRCANHHDCHT